MVVQKTLKAAKPNAPNTARRRSRVSVAISLAAVPNRLP
jgi:hypothetical protein